MQGTFRVLSVIFPMRFFALPILLFLLAVPTRKDTPSAFIRINLLGYQPASTKVAVWCSVENVALTTFRLVDSATGTPVFEKKAGKAYGAYGPFAQTCRLNFSS